MPFRRGSEREGLPGCTRQRCPPMLERPAIGDSRCSECRTVLHLFFQARSDSNFSNHASQEPVTPRETLVTSCHRHSPQTPASRLVAKENRMPSDFKRNPLSRIFLSGWRIQLRNSSAGGGWFTTSQNIPISLMVRRNCSKSTGF